MSQKTDAQLTTAADVIRNATAPNSNSKTRVANMFQDLVDSKVNKADVITTMFAYWDFSANAGAYPEDETKLYITTDDSELPINTWFVSDGAGGWLTK